MDLIDFKDYCVVERDLLDEGGDVVYDGYEEPMREKIYEGACLYQEGGVNSFGIISRRPTLYLPQNVARIEINDVVRVTTEVGREVKSLVDIPRDIRLYRFGTLEITRLELKQATE